MISHKAKDPPGTPGGSFAVDIEAGSVHLAAQEGRDFELLVLLLIAEEILRTVLRRGTLRFGLRTREGCAGGWGETTRALE